MTNDKLTDELLEKLTDYLKDVKNSTAYREQITFLLDNSPFVTLFARQHPKLFIQAFIDPLPNDYKKAYDYFVLDHHYSDFMQSIRLFRRFYSVMIIHHMINLSQPFEVIAYHLSSLADCLINITLDHVSLLIKEKFNLDDIPSMIILALGKLGGRELNFSSDVDLIFLFDEKKGRFSDALSIYTTIAQAFIKCLSQVTPDGFVYRVDMRLRPFGEGSPLVCQVASFNKYCIKHARDWERYAYIKARQVSHYSSSVNQIIEDFVYRNYMDYTVLDAIRGMKTKILNQMKAERLRFNVKLGRGGIREIEFIVQCYQLIYGGQNRHLRTNHLQDALENLANYQHLGKKTTDKLYQNYVFLRNLENVLQIIDDQQAHHLPKNTINKQRVTRMLKFDQWQDLFVVYQRVTGEVKEAFDELTHFREFEHAQLLVKKDSAVKEAMSNIDCKPQLDKQIVEFQLKLKRSGQISNQTYDLVNTLIFFLLIEIYFYPIEDQDLLLANVIKLLKSISRRSTYLHFLIESKDKLHHLVEILSKGDWFCQRLIYFPHLLETVLFLSDDHKQLYLAKLDYKSLLEKRVGQVDIEDKESFIEMLRRFKVEEVFKVAIAEFKRSLTLMETSDVLSALAEAIIEEVLEKSWQLVFQKLAISIGDSERLKNHFCVISYGKLGGFELGFGSDLDLIFLYKSCQSIKDQARIYAKVVQVFIGLMQRESYSGKLYTIDLRLRPSGETGLLVSDINAFEHYQLHQAWTWEHQAITRARWVGGSKSLDQSFEAIRYNVLSKKRNLADLKEEILSMREKMNQKLYKPTKGYFDLKLSKGGMIDIEFLAQYMALAYTSKYREVSLFTDNIRIFQSMESAKILSFEEAQTLIEAYCYYRDLSYDYIFKNRPLTVEVDKLKSYDVKVVKIYEKWLK